MGCRFGTGNAEEARRFRNCLECLHVRTGLCMECGTQMQGKPVPSDLYEGSRAAQKLEWQGVAVLLMVFICRLCLLSRVPQFIKGVFVWHER